MRQGVRHTTEYARIQRELARWNLEIHKRMAQRNPTVQNRRALARAMTKATELRA